MTYTLGVDVYNFMTAGATARAPSRPGLHLAARGKGLLFTETALKGERLLSR